MADEQTISAHEAEEVARANASGKAPVVFVHGLWLLPSSWDRWATVFEEAGYAPCRPAGRTTPTPSRRPTRTRRCSPTRPSARSPTTSRRSSRASTASRRSSATRSAGCSPRSSPAAACRRPRWRSTRRRSAACCRCRSRRSSRRRRCCGNPANRHRAVPLTYEQFRYAFANAVERGRGQGALRDLRGARLGRAALPGGRRQPQPVDRGEGGHQEPRAGPLLIISGEKDHTVPWAIANASYKRQKRQPRRDRDRRDPNRGHSLVIDNGWREVSDTALAFVKRFV